MACLLGAGDVIRLGFFKFWACAAFHWLLKGCHYIRYIITINSYNHINSHICIRIYFISLRFEKTPRHRPSVAADRLARPFIELGWNLSHVFQLSISIYIHYLYIYMHVCARIIFSNYLYLKHATCLSVHIFSGLPELLQVPNWSPSWWWPLTSSCATVCCWGGRVG